MYRDKHADIQLGIKGTSQYLPDSIEVKVSAHQITILVQMLRVLWMYFANIYKLFSYI